MRNLRKFSVFLLFIVVFGVLLYSLFPAALGDMAENLRSGGGTRTFIQAVQGADGVAYALEAERGGGYTLYGTSQDGRVSAQPLSQGLPQDFAVEQIYVAKNGCIVLGLYERAGMELTRYALYAALPEQPFQLLLEAPLTGSTSDQRRASAGLLYAAAAGEQVELAVLQEGEYAAYTFDPAQGQGLVAAGALTEAEAQEAQAANEAALEQARQAVSLAGLPGASVAWLAPTGEGGALALLYERGQMLLSVSPEGGYADLSAGLYRIPWQSGLVLALLAAGVLFLSYGFYYLVCEYQKLYFPLVVKNLLWLGLAGYVAVSAALLIAVGPRYRAGAEQNILAALEAQAAQVSAQDEAGLTQAAQALAQADEDYADCTFLALGQGADGAYQVLASSGPEAAGSALQTPGFLPGVAEQLALAWEKGQYAGHATSGGVGYYYAVGLKAEGGAVYVRVQDGALERQIAGGILELGLYAYGAVALVVLLSLLAIGEAALGARRVTRGVDLLAAGAPQVRVEHHTGDEMEALAAAFNDLSGALEENKENAALAGNAYMRFVPRRLVALLGVANIEQVDKDTSASQEIAMMVVRFRFPEAADQQDAQTLFDNINEVFAHIAGAVSGAGGTIYNFTHDGFDAVFESGPQAAVGAAVGVRQALLELNAQREARGDAPVELRVALDHGVAMMGVVGDEDRVVPTVVSACLNTARKLVELAQVLDANILCTMAVADAAKEYHLRYIGKSRDGDSVLRVYEIFDGDPYGMRLAKESARASFSAGVYALYSGDFAQAKRLFMEIARQQGEDGVARHYLYLADRFEKQAPDWIGLNGSEPAGRREV